MLHEIKKFDDTQPSGPGAISGYEAECTCGFKVRASLRTIAVMDAIEHCLVMNHKDVQPPKGWSLESAYESAKAGVLSRPDMRLAATLPCECGNSNGFDCFNSNHQMFRRHLLSAAKTGIMPLGDLPAN
jgi:hypothetical protein